MLKEIEEYKDYLKSHNYSKGTIKRRGSGLNRVYDYLKENNLIEVFPHFALLSDVRQDFGRKQGFFIPKLGNISSYGLL